MSQPHGCLGDGSLEADVQFQTLEESTVGSVEPPNPYYLKVHAAFAKVLNLCGAAEYMESVWMLKWRGLCAQIGKQILDHTFSPN